MPFSGNIALYIKCRHYFCRKCFEICNKDKPNSCIMCRDIVSADEIKFINNNNNNNNMQITSTKNTEILKIIKLLKPNERFIIFTQFDKCIQSIHKLLMSNNITTLIYSEFIKVAQNIKDNIQVIILSSNEYASGIDLSFVNNVIILEPFENYIYSKEIEKQLIGRVHRINQVKNVDVYRLIIKNTIEEDICVQ